ncbi:hypothetical protein [Methanosarcina sp.]|uniref:hypothetical protein n=1 Tax=Methanosarcina sp. TaxID=2213 RepID=UPI002AB9A787|nr:hypothetical protein [Methanosarcina sp.]MDY9925263.1 hypothetical protein [Methanosarcina sp.]
MSKSTLLRAASLFLGILLCLVSVPAAFAQTGDIEELVAEPVYTSVSNKTIIHDELIPKLRIKSLNLES